MKYKNQEKIVLKLIGCIFAGLIAVTTNAQTQDKVPVVKAVAPVYPPFAIAVRDEGIVKADVSVNRKGIVQSVKVSAAPKLLQTVVEIAARKWVFATDESKQVLRTIQLSFHFQIVPGNTPSDELLPVFKPPYEVEIKAKPPKVN